MYDDDKEDVAYAVKKETKFRVDNSRPYCVISPYTGSHCRELYERAWFEAVEEAQAHAAKCLAGKKSGSIVVVKAVALVSVPLPTVDIVKFGE